MDASILICTRNRAEHLQQTLQAMQFVHLPNGFQAELIVIDNASTDATADAVSRCALPNMPIRYLYEERPGQCYARNTAIAEAKGDILLFTDDDVHPSACWLEGMCAPILAGKAEAVLGGVRFAPYLERSFLTTRQRGLLACTDAYRTLRNPDQPLTLIGANMAFSREVLSRVPSFDVELGPGRLGFLDDSLFAKQLHTAGYRIEPAWDAVVEHHFEVSRLQHSAFLKRVIGEGRSEAYVDHHWAHVNHSRPVLRYLSRRLRLLRWRAKRGEQWRQEEGASDMELIFVRELSYMQHYLQERKRPRQYSERGLVKRTPD